MTPTLSGAMPVRSSPCATSRVPFRDHCGHCGYQNRTLTASHRHRHREPDMASMPWWCRYVEGEPCAKSNASRVGAIPKSAERSLLVGAPRGRAARIHRGLASQTRRRPGAARPLPPSRAGAHDSARRRPGTARVVPRRGPGALGQRSRPTVVRRARPARLPVHETVDGATVWDGEVHVFALAPVLLGGWALWRTDRRAAGALFFYLTLSVPVFLPARERSGPAALHARPREAVGRAARGAMPAPGGEPRLTEIQRASAAISGHCSRLGAYQVATRSQNRSELCPIVSSPIGS